MLRRSLEALVLFSLAISTANAQLSDQLFITEVMWNSSHPGSDDLGEGGHANGDWFELFNASDMEIDMSGFRWDDDDRLSDPDGFTVFPSDFKIQPAETILIVQEDDDTFGFADGFRASWNLPSDLRIFGRDTFADSGPEKFSGISSNGDEINLYDATGALIQSVTLGEATEGFSQAWGFENGAMVDLGLSADGANGGFMATSDGSNGRLLRDANGALVRDANGNTVVDPNTSYVPASLDVGSPGFVFQFTVQPLTVPEICALVSTGERTQADLDVALAAIGSLHGDTDLNGKVDFSDFLLLSGNFGKSILGSQGGWSQGDFSCNGTVEFADFLLLSANFGKSGSAAAAVPEPSTRAMLLLAVLSLFALRRRSR